MSLEAFIWVSSLPLDICGPTAYRVLVKLANHAHTDGRNAWRDNGSLAEEFHCSKRTIERAVRELRQLRLITVGDQRLVERIRADRRPTVYDLNLDYGKAWDQPVELVSRTDMPDGPYGPSSVSRTDSQRPNGPTTVVAQGTVLNPSRESSRSNHRAPVGAFAGPCPNDGHGRHEPASARAGGACLRCGAEQLAQVVAS